MKYKNLLFALSIGIMTAVVIKEAPVDEPVVEEPTE
jgi:hypothetical protein